MNDENDSEDFYSDFSGAESNPELKFKSVEPSVTDLIAQTLRKIRQRSFSDRNPELGKMIKCQVCGQRHRNSKKCVQVFATKWFEEDIETGVVEPILATAAYPKQPTKNQIIGARAFKGKRLLPHLNHTKLQFVERVRLLFGENTLDSESEEYKKALNRARNTAMRQIREERRARARRRRRQQDVSRKINWGVLPAGTLC